MIKNCVLCSHFIRGKITYNNPLSPDIYFSLDERMRSDICQDRDHVLQILIYYCDYDESKLLYSHPVGCKYETECHNCSNWILAGFDDYADLPKWLQDRLTPTDSYPLSVVYCAKKKKKNSQLIICSQCSKFEPLI
jgi:hypothetical protein